MKIFNNPQWNNSILLIELFFCILIVSSCNIPSINSQFVVLDDGVHKLKINTTNFQLSFNDEKGNIIVPSDSISGLLFNENPVIETKFQKTDKSNLALEAKTSNGEKIVIEIIFQNGIADITIIPLNELKNTISLQFGGMPVAHGLGDAGSYEENFNLVENTKQSYPIINNGGTNRWASSFAIFPKNNFAGVSFEHGNKEVKISKKEYSIQIAKKGKATFHYFLGKPKQIYKNYQEVRTINGYVDVKPKYRLFELGWESWDALGWNSNQQTVKDILTKFIENDYPIRWAVTGSGFWDTGGTTTSFGRWGAKYPNPTAFKKWMHKKDIHWMIGLRTNLVPSGGPHYPVTEKRNGNLKVNSFYGNPFTDEAVSKNILLTDENNQLKKLTSSVFPIVPTYLIDGNKSGAANWFAEKYKLWNVDGIKEDTMMDLGQETSIFNKPIAKIARDGALVMARCGEFSASGTLLRINDTKIKDLSKRIPINYFQYAASGFPNVYSDVAGVKNMNNLKDLDTNIRQTWLLALTSGLAVGAYPEKWPLEKQQIFKKAIDFHYAITPYLYSAAIDGFKTGYPTTLTPLSIAFPEDEVVSNMNNFEWMIGESILAVPLLKNYKSGKMDVYLPKGIWFDWETDERFEGPILLKDYKILLNKIPCFVGGKGIVLLRDTKTDKLLVRVYPVNKETSVDFYAEDTELKSTVAISSPITKLNTLWDTTDNKEVKFTKKGKYMEFPIQLGHNYAIKKSME